MFKAFLILALMAATLALTLLGPAHAGQMDAYANPMIAQAGGDTEAGAIPTSGASGPSAASSVEGSAAARADKTEGSARRDTAGRMKDERGRMTGPPSPAR